jgi:hypothetical protein
MSMDFGEFVRMRKAADEDNAECQMVVGVLWMRLSAT